MVGVDNPSERLCYLYSHRRHVKERVSLNPLLTPGIHDEDMTRGWVKGLGFKQTKSRDTVNTPNTLPPHCTSSFSQSLFLIKASHKPCEPWADTLPTFYALSFLRVSYIFKEAFDCLKEKNEIYVFCTLFYKTDMCCINCHTISKE